MGRRWGRDGWVSALIFLVPVEAVRGGVLSVILIFVSQTDSQPFHLAEHEACVLQPFTPDTTLVWCSVGGMRIRRLYCTYAYVLCSKNCCTVQYSKVVVGNKPRTSTLFPVSCFSCHPLKSR